MTEHPIRLRNSASQDKRPQQLVPLDWRDESVAPADRRVRMYVCGPTVYDRAHIGNARPVVVFDVLFRLLRHVYGENAVTYVRNITDVDDKINKRAAETRRDGESTLDAVRRITDETTRWYHEDMAALGALPPTHEPRATEFVSAPDCPSDMIRMIQALIERGCAYEAEGHVLFEVAKWPEYGHLSRRPLDEMEAGARVEVAPYKRSPLDFVLWKPSDDTLPGWDSPWGRGRPGWHIECSAMSRALLGERFDIHGGGIDLQFPHHENELAQSCCANGTDAMASIWMHNGYLMVEGEKMSKSLGNFFTVRDLLDKGVPGEVIRYVLLATHYRAPLDWTEKRLEEAEAIVSRFFHRLSVSHLDFSSADAELHSSHSAYAPHEDFVSALANDLNTPQAIAHLHSLARSGASEDVNQLMGALKLLGFIDSSARIDALAGSGVSWMGDYGKVIERKVMDVLFERQEARRRRDYARADALRDGLREAGVDVQDTSTGPEYSLRKEFDLRKLEALR